MFYEQLENNAIVEKLNRFLRSKLMICIIVVLAGISNIFGLELPVYYTYAIIVALTVLFSKDMLPTFPIACCGYITFSRNSNPLGVENSTFREQHNQIQLIIIASVIAILALSRIVFDLVKHKNRRKKPKLLGGFVLILITNLLGGLLTDLHDSKTIFYGLIHAVSISFTYFIFYYTINWKKVKKDYFMFVSLLIGIVLLFECFNTYILCGNFNATEGFLRKYVFTGWGMYNNMALMCVLSLPAPFYYMYTNKHKLPFALLTLLMYINLFLLQSRNGILFGSITLLLCALTISKRSHNTKLFLKALGAASLVILAFAFIAIPKLQNTFMNLIDKGLYMGDRYRVYRTSWKAFMNNPLFGSGFYAFEEFVWNLTSHSPKFLPPRSHNTYLQILASTGISGILAYVYHRYQTIKITLNCHKDISLTLIKISLLAFMLMSLLDCHFHNFGPGLTYSAMLLIIEKIYYKEKEDSI